MGWEATESQTQNLNCWGGDVSPDKHASCRLWEQSGLRVGAAPTRPTCDTCRGLDRVTYGCPAPVPSGFSSHRGPCPELEGPHSLTGGHQPAQVHTACSNSLPLTTPWA